MNNVHLVDKYLLKICYVPGTFLLPEDTVMIKSNKTPCPVELTF